jgi:hypothetical protein
VILAAGLSSFAPALPLPLRMARTLG